MIEIEHAEISIIKVLQDEAFKDEIRALLSDKSISARSRILSLNPFLDANNILRVGGRLANSSFLDYKIHPILLPSKHLVTKLIFRD